MTIHIDPIQTAIALLVAEGYTVTKPKARKAPVRADLLRGYRPAMKAWDRVLVSFTFGDGVTVSSYALRENERKQWFLGAAARAACDKYRYRTGVIRIDAVAVPDIVAVSGVPVDIDALNAAVAWYREPMSTRERLARLSAE